MIFERGENIRRCGDPFGSFRGKVMVAEIFVFYGADQGNMGIQGHSDFLFSLKGRISRSPCEEKRCEFCSGNAWGLIGLKNAVE
jgi:hypothetical protein